MNRSFPPNPDTADFCLVRCQLNDEEVGTWIANTGLDRVPEGFRPYIRATGNLLEWGIEKIPAAGSAPAPKGDGLDGQSIAELQTRCAMKGIKYAKEDGKTALVGLLRKGKP